MEVTGCLHLGEWILDLIIPSQTIREEKKMYFESTLNRGRKSLRTTNSYSADKVGH